MFNKRLREIRLRRHMTQQKMADAIGVALRTYQCYETGTREPSFSLLVRMADVLDVFTDELLCRDSYLTSHGVSVDEH